MKQFVNKKRSSGSASAFFIAATVSLTQPMIVPTNDGYAQVTFPSMAGPKPIEQQQQAANIDPHVLKQQEIDAKLAHNFVSENPYQQCKLTIQKNNLPQGCYSQYVRKYAINGVPQSAVKQTIVPGKTYTATYKVPESQSVGCNNRIDESVEPQVIVDRTVNHHVFVQTNGVTSLEDDQEISKNLYDPSQLPIPHSQIRLPYSGLNIAAVPVQDLFSLKPEILNIIDSIRNNGGDISVNSTCDDHDALYNNYMIALGLNHTPNNNAELKNHERPTYFNPSASMVSHARAFFDDNNSQDDFSQLFKAIF